MSTYTIVVGDCRTALAAMQPGSVDAIVTDPPYGLEFMGKDWDAPWKGQADGDRAGFSDVVMADGYARRPAPAYTGSPNLTCRNCGGTQRGQDRDSRSRCRCDAPDFPNVRAMQGLAYQQWCEGWARECYRVLKPGGRMLAFGGTRMHHRMFCAIEDAGFVMEDTVMWLFGSGFPKHRSKLKPAYEPVCVARKGPVTALNIDACRVGLAGMETHTTAAVAGFKHTHGGGLTGHIIGGKDLVRYDSKGRWPANVMLGCSCESEHEPDCAVRLLDEQSGETSETPRVLRRNGKRASEGWGLAAESTGVVHGDCGGASRFFFVAKASRSERNAGLDGLPKRNGGSNAKGFTDDVANGQDRNRPVANSHPTVKPVELMRYLVRLVTPEGGTVLDPFCGSGSTGVACTLEGRAFVGIELDPDYAAIAERRIRQTQPSLFGDGAA